MSLEVFIWVIEILAILFCICGVVGMAYYAASLVYRKQISKMEYEKMKKEQKAELK